MPTRRSIRRASCAFLAAFVAAGVPAAGLAPGVGVADADAPTATIALDQACYVRTGSSPPPMTITGTGFTPRDPVAIADSRGTLHATTTADATGAIAASIAGPAYVLREPGQVSDEITATDDTAAGTTIVGRAPTHISILGAGHGSTRSEHGLRALTERTRWVFSGWPPGQTIYVHYLVHGRAVARQSFGRPTAPCGVLRTVRPLFPKTPHVADYATQIDTQRPFSVKADPRFTLLEVGLQLEFATGHSR